MTDMNQIQGIVFDKDGTLFDFNATWGAWSRKMLHNEAGGDQAALDALAQALGYDLTTDRFLPGSIVIAETVDVVAGEILTVLPHLDKQDLIQRMNAAAREVPQVEATPLRPFIAGLRDQKLTLGVATNDAEDPARRHLDQAGVLEAIDFVAGYDSGFGGKPAPGQLLAFCERFDLAPGSCVMVGDSLHDLHAGRAAGMICVGVLTGPAPHDELAPHADIVLPSIADLPRWLSEPTRNVGNA